MNISTNGGLVKAIIIIIAILLILSYFGLSIRSIVNSPTGQDNLSYSKQILFDIWKWGVKVWNNYLKKPVVYVYNLFVRLIWTPMIDNLEKMNRGEPVNYEEASPKLPASVPTIN